MYPEKTRGWKAGLGFGFGAARFSREETVGVGGAAGCGVDAFFLRLPAYPWVMKDPPSIKAEPIACRRVNFSCRVTNRQQHGDGHLQLDHRCGEVHAHQLVGLVVAITADDEMHDALARQPGESRRREHHELMQLAKGDGHDQEGKSADRHG